MALLPQQTLWPIHCKPFEDELLSNLLVRLAHSHGLKAQTFCDVVFGSRHQVWNRDVDRLGPDWLIREVSTHTGETPAAIRATTLRVYEGKLYRSFREYGVLKWMLTLAIYHRTRRGHGLQYCARCLAEDPEPYFRKRWRVALCTYCVRHNAMLRDRCPRCQSPVIFHRLELGRPRHAVGAKLCYCFQCGFDLRDSVVEAPVFYEESAHQAFEIAIRRLEPPGPTCRPRSVRYYNVLHHLCWLLTCRYRRVALLDFAVQATGAPRMAIAPARPTFEERPVEERHHLVQLAFWFLADLDARLTSAWESRAVTYSALLRDFDDRPDWFDRVVERFSDWRRTFCR
jgi:hypothetical protein